MLRLHRLQPHEPQNAPAVPPPMPESHPEDVVEASPAWDSASKNLVFSIKKMRRERWSPLHNRT